MIPRYLLLASAFLLLALLGFTVFPGHSWLQSDTQIYIPILERQFDHTLYSHDEIALRPHVKFTFYDEIAVGLRRLTGASFQTILQTQQFLFRAAGIAGAFCIALALGLPTSGALLAAGVFAAGAVINGPAVLTMEYEPVPRGFAILIIIAALGAAVHRRWMWAGLLAVLATLYHPTTTAPFWLCLVLHWRFAHDRREGIALEASIAAAAAGLVLFAGLQAYGTDRQVWLGQIPPELERIQKFRGAYNWVSLWPREWLFQYPLLFAAAVVSWRRIRAFMTPEARFLTLALLIYGLAMIPLQYLLLDLGKWILMPQFQPARAVLFITALASLLAIAAAWQAARARRLWETGAWFLIVFAIPVNGLVVQLFFDGNWPRIAVTLLLAALATAATLYPRAAFPVALSAFFLIPHLAGVSYIPRLHTPELDNAAAWAEANTSRDDIFFFPDTARGLQPGVFRANSLRGLYVDWKSGGQANLLRDYGFEWWKRWQATNQARPPLRPLEDYRNLGIDYLVIQPRNLPAGVTPAYRNASWAVLRLKP
ncbi:MAG: hypothetical protein HY821_20810 [Acidobacteria bacterium]|nr:hypothetical protein [Acidobacteriota bacterium]